MSNQKYVPPKGIERMPRRLWHLIDPKVWNSLTPEKRWELMDNTKPMQRAPAKN